MLCNFVTNLLSLDSRRYIRPFFMTPEGKSLPNKRYYDIASWFLTQMFFAYTVAPFALLRLSPSLAVWSRVYFFGIIGVAGAFGFFASPAKPWLASRVKARMERPGIVRMKSDTGDGVMLGVPVDVEKELNELVAEVKAEIDRRKAMGMTVPDVRALVKEKLSNVNLPGVDKEKVKKEL
jgi:lysophospholipid acyltransferase